MSEAAAGSSLRDELARWGLHVKQDPVKGRCIVASRRRRPGEVIFRESASLFMLDRRLWGEHCFTCASKLDDASKVEVAWPAMFCSVGCEAEWRKRWPWEADALPMLSGKEKDSGGDAANLDADLILCRELHMRIHNDQSPYSDFSFAMLGTGRESSATEDLPEHYPRLSTLYPAGLPPVASATVRAHWPKPLEHEDGLGERPEQRDTPAIRLVQDALAVHGSHAFGVRNSSLSSVGMAIYLGASLLNHSCCANCWVRFEGTTLELRALESVEEGEELTFAYYDWIRDTATRKKELQQQYGFECKCDLCSHPASDWLGAAPDSSDVGVLGDLGSMALLNRVDSPTLADPARAVALLMANDAKLKAVLGERMHIARLAILTELASRASSAHRFDLVIRTVQDIQHAHMVYYGTTHPRVGSLHMKAGQACMRNGSRVGAALHLTVAQFALLISHGPASETFKLVQELLGLLKQTLKPAQLERVRVEAKELLSTARRERERFLARKS